VSEAALGEGTQRLLEEQVRSIEELEVLMALQAERASWLPVQLLASKVRLSLESTRTAVEQLAAKGLVSSDPSGVEVRYAPASAELDARVEQLVLDYTNHRVELLVLISSNAMNRVRKGALHTFSEAFRLRGPKKDG
jgi:hypothetical protein